MAIEWLPQVDFGQLQFTSDEVGKDVSSCLQHSISTMRVLVHNNHLKYHRLQFNLSYIID
jgi:hypothetical protein